MPDFILHIPALAWTGLGIAAAAALLTVFYLLLPLRRVARMPEPVADDEPVPEKAPKVSVVCYSTVDEEQLAESLLMLTSQDYPDYEIIVVCDATFETSEMLAEKYAETYSNVYVTFIPPGSHNLSRRKLALTLGIKAAKGDIIVTTVANAAIPSERWLSMLTEPFRENPGIDVSLGNSRFDFSQMPGAGKWYKEFVSLLTDARWIGYAAAGSPYRGDGTNLAFRRELFFKCKGYSKSMHLHGGDDDLFINEIATDGNTAVVVSPDVTVLTSWGDSSKRVWTMRKSIYDFTSRWLPRGPFLRAGAASLCQWLVLGGCAAAVVFGLPNIIPAIIAGVLWILFELAQIDIYRKAASRMQATRLWWSIPIFWLYKPIGNAFFKLKHRRTRIKNFTWQRQRPKIAIGPIRL